MQIYESFIDIEPLDGCSLINKDAAGAFVYFYVAAESLEESISKMKQFLLQDNFQLVDIDYIRTVNLEEWESENNTECPNLSELNSCFNNTSHLYSVFHSYLSKYEH